MGIATTGATSLAKYSLKKLIEQLRGNDLAVSKAMDEQKEEILFELQQVVEKHEALFGDSMSLREAMALIRPLIEESMRSAETERIKLLSFAIAGIFDPDLAMEMKSRVSRSLALLEPSDVRKLREIAVATGEQKQVIGGNKRGSDLAPLVQAGCLHLDYGRYGGIPYPELTEVGDAVLKSLQEWGR